MNKDNSSKLAEDFICEFTCAESLEELKKDSWSASEVHEILMDFAIYLYNKEFEEKRYPKFI